MNFRLSEERQPRTRISVPRVEQRADRIDQLVTRIRVTSQIRSAEFVAAPEQESATVA